MAEPPATLTYDPAGERLSGSVDGRAVDLRACSGGHRGATDPSRWSDTPESWDQHRVGGPLPAGRYTIIWLGDYIGWSGHRFGPACFLLPDPQTRARITAVGRIWHDFLLHGPGPSGSDGCLVPFPDPVFRDLIATLKGRIDEPVGSLRVRPMAALSARPAAIAPPVPSAGW